MERNKNSRYKKKTGTGRDAARETESEPGDVRHECNRETGGKRNSDPRDVIERQAARETISDN